MPGLPAEPSFGRQVVPGVRAGRGVAGSSGVSRASEGGRASDLPTVEAQPLEKRPGGAFGAEGVGQRLGVRRAGQGPGGGVSHWTLGRPVSSGGDDRGREG